MKEKLLHEKKISEVLGEKFDSSAIPEEERITANIVRDIDKEHLKKWAIAKVNKYQKICDDMKKESSKYPSRRESIQYTTVFAIKEWIKKHFELTEEDLK